MAGVSGGPEQSVPWSTEGLLLTSGVPHSLESLELPQESKVRQAQCRQLCEVGMLDRGAKGQGCHEKNYSED